MSWNALRSRTWRVALLGALLALPGLRPLSAQVTVLPRQGLGFGQLTPGVPATVTTSDVARRAEYLLQGVGQSQMLLVLPTRLTNAKGATIPLSFGATDALVKWKSRQSVVNPNAGFTVKTTPADGDAVLYLGGTASPAVGQQAGTYTATITLMIVGL
jgi:hypothetical protein